MGYLQIAIIAQLCYTVFLHYQIIATRKKVIQVAAKTATAIVKGAVPTIITSNNLAMSSQVEDMEGRIMAYLEQHTNIPVPEE